LEKINTIKNETLKKSKSNSESDFKKNTKRIFVQQPANNAIFNEEKILGDNAQIELGEKEHIFKSESYEIKENSEINRLKNIKKIENNFKKEQKGQILIYLEKEKLFKEEEIMKKVENYKTTLTKDLVNFLSEEKLLELERDKLYNNCDNPIEKKRLEKIISMERAASSQKIIEMNKEIERKLKVYEEMLRK
jgi:hypothetical protein